LDIDKSRYSNFRATWDPPATCQWTRPEVRAPSHVAIPSLLAMSESAHSACQISEPVGLGLRVRVRVSENRLQPRLSSVIRPAAPLPAARRHTVVRGRGRESRSSDLTHLHLLFRVRAGSCHSREAQKPGPRQMYSSESSELTPALTDSARLLA
jgi:hypothetical protein